MTNIIITKEYKYLGEYPLFKENGLPVGYLIDKGKVGCGGTSIALEDNKDTIICVPFVSLIKNKMQKYNTDGKVNVLGVYEGLNFLSHTFSPFISRHSYPRFSRSYTKS